MQVKYIIESKYYNGDEYADKLDTLTEVVQVLKAIEELDTDTIPDNARIDSKQISVTTEEV